MCSRLEELVIGMSFLHSFEGLLRERRTSELIGLPSSKDGLRKRREKNEEDAGVNGWMVVCVMDNRDKLCSDFDVDFDFGSIGGVLLNVKYPGGSNKASFPRTTELT